VDFISHPRKYSAGINGRSLGITKATQMGIALQQQELRAPRQTALMAFQRHWPEYVMEGACLALFMLSACTFTVLLEHPMSPVQQALNDAAFLRRALIAVAMGLTAVALVKSPWGQRSGAHMNPAITLTYLTLGKIAHWDALFYLLFQFVGGITGVAIAHALIGPPLSHSAVNFAVTVPGPQGAFIAFLAEFAISTLLMMTILLVSNSRRLSRYTPFFAGTLVASFITFEAPLSGMSMNPARTFGSALNAQEWTALGVYFAAPLAGMLLASIVYRLRFGVRQIYCAKLDHHNNKPCIFRCRFGELNANR
jgi:aquaporin Z